MSALGEDGWLAAARRVPSPNYDARPTGVPVELVVIHAISLPPGQFGGPYVCDLFCNQLDPTAHDYFAEVADSRVSAHFLIDREGRLTQFVSVADRAWHAGASNWQGRGACNDFSVGIELEGCDELPFSDLQYDCLVELLRALADRLPVLTGDHIVGHSDIAPARKTDPGPYFDWARLRRSLRT